MSGHNRWSKIKRQKEAMGSSKGKLFTKLIKEITVAARQGGGEVAGNHRLRTALEAAHAANLPGDTIARAIKKGTGELAGEAYEEVTYEGYGPGGVALLVECVTDNRHRTASEIRHIFAKGGGAMGESGSVGWMFEKRGLIEVKPGKTEDEVVEAALDVGADDVVNHGEDGFEIRIEPHDLGHVGEQLRNRGLPLGEQKVSFVPKNTVALEGAKVDGVLSLIDLLMESEDVQDVHANLAFAGPTGEAATA